MLKSSICVILIIIVNYSVYSKQTFYCEESSQLIKISDLNEEYEIITRIEGEKQYKPNKVCEWIIEAPDNNRISLSDFDIDLPFKADYASCNMHDYLKIEETNSSIEICRANSIKSVLSKLNKLSIKFSSNTFAAKAKGIQFSIQAWEPSKQCPKTWFKTKDEKCLKIYDADVKLSLEDSQTHCRYVQSNLASFDGKYQIDEFVDFVNANKKGSKKIESFWIGLTDIVNAGKLVWIEDDKPFTLKEINVRKDGENGDKNCVSIVINFEKNSTNEFSRISCTQKTIKKPFICKMNQTGSTRLFNLPAQREIKDELDSSFAIFLKIGFPILAILIGVCLVALFIMTIKYGNKCSKDNHSAARITVYATLTILTILFFILFVIGILTRKTVVMAIGIPILVLIFLTIVTILCLSIKGKRDQAAKRGSTNAKGTETELEDLRPKNQTKNTELPSYEDVMNP